MDEQKIPAFPVTLFYVYAHADEKLRQKLEIHLSTLSRQGFITTWHDRQIMPGTHWKQALDDHLNTASVILLLISPDFLASDYCYSVEMRRALARHEEGNACVIPILLRPVDWESSLFSILQALPRNAKPVTSWSNYDAAFTDITKGIRRVIETFGRTSSTTHSSLQNGLVAPLSHRDLLWNTNQSNMRARIKYLKHIEGSYSFIMLPLGPVEGLLHRAVFQPLRLRRDPLTAEDRQREERRPLLGEPAPTDNEPHVIAKNGEEALAKSTQSRIIVLGGPGTGKTTLLQSLVSERIQQSLIDPTAPIPILLSLPDLARSGRTLPEYLVHLMKEIGVSEYSTDLLWQIIEEGRAFVCLDSLDEVTPRQRPEMIRLINELATRSGNTWVVGSRYTEYKGGQFKRGQFAEWELLPLDHEMREHFALRLLPELYRLLPEAAALGATEPSLFVQSLEHHRRAAAWGENPLLFGMAAAVFVRTGILPMGLAALYQQVIDAVVQLREPDLTRQKVLLRAVAALALELYQIRGRTFTRDDIVTLIPVVRQKQHENWSTEEMVNRIIDSGLLDVVARETYGFRHQTFQEYLAAVALAQRLVSQDHAIREEVWTFIWGKRMYSRWTEILHLMAGVLAQDHRREGARQVKHWLIKLARQRTRPEGDVGDLGITFAMESLPEISGMKKSKWEEEGGEEAEIEIVTLWVAALLDKRKLGRRWQPRDLSSLALYINSLNGHAINAAVKKLLAALEGENAQIREVVIQALKNLWKHIPIESFVVLLNDMSTEVRRVAAHLLANWDEQFPEKYLPIVLSNDDPIVRQHFERWHFMHWYEEAMQAHSGEPLTTKQLEQALHAADWHVRVLAPQFLGPLGVQIPVEAFLTDLNDKDDKRRRGAVLALGELGKDAPIELLLGMLGDEDVNVRMAVAFALRKLKPYVSLERLLATLNDDNLYVRRGAMDVLARREERSIKWQDSQGTLIHDDIEEPFRELGELTLVEPLLQALRDQDSMIRNSAAETLVYLGDRVPVEPLIAALHDESVRYYIVKALGNVKVDVPLEPLFEALLDQEKYMRKVAAEALVKMGVYPPEQFLLENLASRLTWMRATALEVLWSVGERLPIEALQTLLNDQDTQVRAKALEILGKLGEQAPVEPLLSALNDNDVGIRTVASAALGKRGRHVPLEPLLHAVLYDEEKQVREEMARALGELGALVPVEPFLTALHDERVSVRAAAADVLGELGTRTPLEPLLLALDDHDPAVRSMVIWALGEQGERTPVEKLVAALNDEDESVRLWAISALGRLGDRAPVSALISALHDESKQVRSDAVWTLRKVTDQVPVEPLLEMLHSENEQARIAALQVLGRLTKSLPLEPLLTALSDKQAEVRMGALQALGNLSEQVPVEMLLAALSDTNWSVYSYALELAVKMGKRIPLEPLLVALDREEDTGERAAEVLEKRLSEESLLVALGSTHWSMRSAAARLLGKRRVHHSVTSLLPLLKDRGGENFRVAEAVIQALGELGGPVDPLVTILNDNSFTQTSAARVLGRLGVFEPLVTALDNENHYVRRAAVLGLGESKDPESFKLVVAALGDSAKEVRDEALRQAHPDALLALVPEAIAILQGSAPGTILGSMLQGVIAEAIGNLGFSSPALLEKVTQLLDWPYWEVRVEAAQALGKLRRNIPDTAIRCLLELRHDPQSRAVCAAANDALAEILSLETGIEDD